MESAENETGRREGETVVETEAKEPSGCVVDEAVSRPESQENGPEEQRSEDRETGAVEESGERGERGERGDVGSEEEQEGRGEEGLDGESEFQGEGRPDTVEEEGGESGSDDTSEEEGEGEKVDGESRGKEAGSMPGSSRWGNREERLKRLRELHKRRLDARQLNHREVVEEDRRNKLPANWEAKQRTVAWEEEDEKARQEAEAAGEDYEKEKMMKTSASELERLERKRKKNPDPGFSDYAQAQFRQYDRLTKQFKPDMEAYERQKMEMGADFYPGVNSLVHGGAGKVSKAGIERMTEDLEKQIEKRSKYSRRRPVNQDGNVDYINERNMRFNKKAARYYDKYTAELKQNLERGTAV